MSQYPEEAPAFSSDEETKNANGSKTKTAKTAKKQPEAKTQPNKSFNENYHNARFQFPGFSTQTGNSESHWRSRIRASLRRSLKKFSRKVSRTSSMATICFVRPNRVWAKRQCSSWVSCTPSKCQEILSSASCFVLPENWPFRSQRSSSAWGSTYPGCGLRLFWEVCHWMSRNYKSRQTRLM